MGLILDSSIFITAERNGERVAALLKRLMSKFGDQEAAMSAIALVELAHGIHRANTADVRARREPFIQELLADVPVYPFTQQIAFTAGQIDATQQARGVKIPFPDLLIGATALSLGYSVGTSNLRHFRMVTGLSVGEL
jgi:predicted nucleic acid-binding protein